MMPWAGCTAAYLVMTYVMTTSGEVVEEGSTVCFDLALALEMAEMDCACVAGACVFALNERGQIANQGCVATFGLFEPAGRTASGPAMRAEKAVQPNTFRLS